MWASFFHSWPGSYGNGRFFFLFGLRFSHLFLRCFVFFWVLKFWRQFWRFSDTQARFFVVHFLEGWKILEKNWRIWTFGNCGWDGHLVDFGFGWKIWVNTFLFGGSSTNNPRMIFKLWKLKRNNPSDMNFSESMKEQLNTWIRDENLQPLPTPTPSNGFPWDERYIYRSMNGWFLRFSCR